MKKLLRRMMKFFAYLTAGVVIILAIAVGLFRLFLPRLPVYQDEIKAWASAAVGMQVEFSGMDARWGLSGPEVEFYDAELIRPDSDSRLIAAQEVRMGVGLVRLLVDRTVVVDRIVIRKTAVNVRQLEDGRFQIQGNDVDDLLNIGSGGAAKPVQVEFIGEEIDLVLLQPGEQKARAFSIPRLRIGLDDKRVAADADVILPDDLGNELKVSATQLLDTGSTNQDWDISIQAKDIVLSGWSEVLSSDNEPTNRRIESGRGDIDLALAFVDGRVTNATAELDFSDVAFSEDKPIDVVTRLEVNIADDGWLIAANDLTAALPDHDWPETSLRVEAATDSERRIVMLDVQASYLNLDDLGVVDVWLTDELRNSVAQFSPSGVVRDLAVTVSDIDTDDPTFNVSAELLRVGLAETTERPGMRGFSGSLNASREGGRLEIHSANMLVNASGFVDDPIAVQIAEGTVIWRSSQNRTTVLSDSIRIDSDVFQSQSNLHLTYDGNGVAPEIDLASRWSVSDIAAAKRYIPRKIMTPKLYDWFQSALVEGSITNGTAELHGRLDRFPFDGDKGRLLINATVQDLTLKYHRDWPAAGNADVDVVVENARLYSNRNHSTSAGLSVTDAKVNIPDLRQPVLKVESFSTGTLGAIRQFSLQSPIAKVFGGHLEKVSASGDAAIALELDVPLKKPTDFAFVSKIRSNNGSLSIAGFSPPISDLIGEVTLERERISSDALAGRFLGQDIEISLSRSDDPRFAVAATVDGTLTAEGVIGELGVPVDGLIDGATPYRAWMLFPDRKAPSPAPLILQFETDLQGFELNFPEPVAKTRDESLPVSGDIRFLQGGDVIASAGTSQNGMAWELAFYRPEGVWDFDRGVFSVNQDVTASADTRGLHIRGSTDVVRLDDWLELSRSDEKNLGAAERIRSIDLRVENLHIVGQHLIDHRVQVDRSALDWLVQFEGDHVAGSVFVPYDFGGDRAMILEMEKLRLPGNDSEVNSATSFDPRKLPPITLTADDLAFGDRSLGAVQATMEKIENGLSATTIHSKDDSFEIVGSGRWVADDTDPLGSRSFVTAALSSNNVMETMTRLNYQPGISSNDMSIQFDLDWSGSPRADFLDVLDGEVQVQLGQGQLDEVEPGAGRVFGLMSIVALPRRLSLDFRDVFNKGFAFDKIAGTFRLVDGKTYTCDLSLEGPAADIGVVGEADLARRTYNQTAIVSANVGNTLPIVGAVVAGPQVAAALLIFSQIFKKPLQEVGQVYYSINGPWGDQAAVSSTNSDALVKSSELAGCLADTR